MSVKVEFIDEDYLQYEYCNCDSLEMVNSQERTNPYKCVWPNKVKEELEWDMASQGGDTTVTVVPQAQILQVSQPSVSVQLSPENSVDSSHSISVTNHPSIQEEGGVLSSGGNSEEGIQGPDTSPGHYITVTASEGGSEDVTHSYVQYIESTGEQTIYTTSNGQMYPVYTVGESGTMYTPSSGQYYSPGNTTPVTYTQVANSLSGGTTGQLIGNTAYLIQQGVEPEGMLSRASPQAVSADVAYLVNASGGGSQISESTPDSSTTSPTAPNIVHATRVSPTTVQWLLENYETAEGVSLPRSTLYNHYLRHCYENKLDPVNAASFGKLIRSVFLGLRTRRLGTRGNSKYHYYGIRLKSSSSLCQSQDSGGEEGSSRSGKRFRVSQTKMEDPVQATPLQEYLGDSTNAIPELPPVEVPNGFPLPPMCSLEDIDTFRSIYREHCEAFLDAIVNLEFATIETLWREFWRSQENTNGDECEEEKYLSKTKLLLLSKLRPVQEFVKRVDFLFYQNLVQVLIPDVLRPIPSSLTQAIRNFAKGLESWLSAAMAGCPTDMVDIKVSAVCALGQTLRRYTSLNHLAQAARAVLQNSVQINQMLADLNRVDFHNVQEQASWVCECDGGLVARLEADFKTTLQTQNSLEEWASWLKAVVNSVLKPYRGRRGFSAAARQLLLKWSFYSSMVIRDLTLRSAASFGSFHLIRLLYDEYMFYLVEHQVANATGTSPIAVMASKSCGLDYSERNGNNNNNNNNNNSNINNNKDEDDHATKKMRLS